MVVIQEACMVAFLYTFNLQRHQPQFLPDLPRSRGCCGLPFVHPAARQGEVRHPGLPDQQNPGRLSPRLRWLWPFSPACRCSCSSLRKDLAEDAAEGPGAFVERRQVGDEAARACQSLDTLQHPLVKEVLRPGAGDSVGLGLSRQ